VLNELAVPDVSDRVRFFPGSLYELTVTVAHGSRLSYAPCDPCKLHILASGLVG